MEIRVKISFISIFSLFQFFYYDFIVYTYRIAPSNTVINDVTSYVQSFNIFMLDIDEKSSLTDGFIRFSNDLEHWLIFRPCTSCNMQNLHVGSSHSYIITFRLSFHFPSTQVVRVYCSSRFICCNFVISVLLICFSFSVFLPSLIVFAVR